MTERRRRAAGASRLLVGGLSTAATLGLTAGFALTAPPPVRADTGPTVAVATVTGVTAAAPDATQQPRRVVVVVRRHVGDRSAASAPVLADVAPRPAPAASRPAPAASTSGS